MRGHDEPPNVHGTVEWLCDGELDNESCMWDHNLKLTPRPEDHIKCGWNIITPLKTAPNEDTR